MTRKRPDIQKCGERHEPYLHCRTCNPVPAEDPARLQGPEIGTEWIYNSPKSSNHGQRVVVLERSYVWGPGDPSYHGGARRYDWKVVQFPNGGRLVVDDKDLVAVA